MKKPATKQQFLLDYRDGCLCDRGKRWIDNEQARVEALWQSEREVFPGWVIGADEVGRGPMAGPLVAAAAASDRPIFLPGLNDSKKLSVVEREVLSDLILASSIQVKIYEVPVTTINTGNLHQLSLQAMLRATQQISITPDRYLIDGKYPLPIRADQKTIIGGDRCSALIAAASIVAKVYRDRLMRELARAYPGYGWESNVGYCTGDHQAALIKLGPTPHHRTNYRPVRALLPEQLQLSL